MKRAGLMIILTALVAAAPSAFCARVTENDGDWSKTEITLRDTPEAALMVRVGDIDNLGFGFAESFDPFAGGNTPGHAFPWSVNPSDPPGTDRIMVISSYVGRPPNGSDGYTSSTQRPGNSVQAISMIFDLQGLTLLDAALQIFVDDFQAPNWGARYTVTLNDQAFPELETIINSLSQTGPIGKLISVAVPPRFFAGIAAGQLVLNIDDLTTGAGDGYAIDFVKLLVNRAGVLPVGTIAGTVIDAVSRAPIAGASIRSFDREATTDAQGNYSLSGVPAGLAFVQASANGYETKSRTVDLLAGQTVSNVSFELPRAASVLSIYVAAELEFFGFAGSNYALQYSADLEKWSDDELISGEGKMVTRFRTTRSAHARYWRVVPR